MDDALTEQRKIIAQQQNIPPEQVPQAQAQARLDAQPKLAETTIPDVSLQSSMSQEPLPKTLVVDNAPQQFESDNIQLVSGEWMNRKTYLALPPEQQGLINELGIKKFLVKMRDSPPPRPLPEGITEQQFYQLVSNASTMRQTIKDYDPELQERVSPATRITPGTIKSMQSNVDYLDNLIKYYQDYQFHYFEKDFGTPPTKEDVETVLRGGNVGAVFAFRELDKGTIGLTAKDITARQTTIVAAAQFHQDNVELLSGEYIAKEDWDKLSPDDQYYLRNNGIQAFNNSKLPKALGAPTFDSLQLATLQLREWEQIGDNQEVVGYSGGEYVISDVKTSIPSGTINAGIFAYFKDNPLKANTGESVSELTSKGYSLQEITDAQAAYNRMVSYEKQSKEQNDALDEVNKYAKKVELTPAQEEENAIRAAKGLSTTPDYIYTGEALALTIKNNPDGTQVLKTAGFSDGDIAQAAELSKQNYDPIAGFYREGTAPNPEIYVDAYLKRAGIDPTEYRAEKKAANRPFPDASRSYDNLLRGEKIERDAIEEYKKRYGTMNVILSDVEPIASALFSPARAIAPDVLASDISGAEWALGAGQAITTVGIFTGFGAVGKTLYAAGVGAFGASLAMDWDKLNNDQRTIGVVSVAAFATLPFAISGIAKGLKVIGKEINPQYRAVIKSAQEVKASAKELDDAIAKIQTLPSTGDEALAAKNALVKAENGNIAARLDFVDKFSILDKLDKETLIKLEQTSKIKGLKSAIEEIQAAKKAEQEALKAVDETFAGSPARKAAMENLKVSGDRLRKALDDYGELVKPSANWGVADEGRESSIWDKDNWGETITGVEPPATKSPFVIKGNTVLDINAGVKETKVTSLVESTPTIRDTTIETKYYDINDLAAAARQSELNAAKIENIGLPRTVIETDKGLGGKFVPSQSQNIAGDISQAEFKSKIGGTAITKTDSGVGLGAYSETGKIKTGYDVTQWGSGLPDDVKIGVSDTGGGRTAASLTQPEGLKPGYQYKDGSYWRPANIGGQPEAAGGVYRFAPDGTWISVTPQEAGAKAMLGTPLTSGIGDYGYPQLVLGTPAYAADLLPSTIGAIAVKYGLSMGNINGTQPLDNTELQEIARLLGLTQTEISVALQNNSLPQTIINKAVSSLPTDDAKVVTQAIVASYPKVMPSIQDNPKIKEWTQIAAVELPSIIQMQQPITSQAVDTNLGISSEVITESKPQVSPQTVTQTAQQTQAQPVTETPPITNTPIETGITQIDNPPPPPPPSGRTPTITPFIPLDDEKKKTREEYEAAFAGNVAWKQGFGWWSIKPPYKTDEDKHFFYGKDPPAGMIAVEGGAGAAYRSIQASGGEIPDDFAMDLGIMDIKISKPTGAPGAAGAITYTEDTEQSRRLDRQSFSEAEKQAQARRSGAVSARNMGYNEPEIVDTGDRYYLGHRLPDNIEASI